MLLIQGEREGSSVGSLGSYEGNTPAGAAAMGFGLGGGGGGGGGAMAAAADEDLHVSDHSPTHSTNSKSLLSF